MPISKPKQIVGHSRSMDTYGVYAHEMTGQLALSAAQINDLFAQAIAPKAKQQK